MTPYMEPMASAYQANKSRRPQAAIKAGLFNHLVGAGEQRGWHFKADRLGSREVDHQFVFDRRLHRQVGSQRSRKYLAIHLIFKSFDDIVDHCCYAWNTLIDHPCPLRDATGQQSVTQTEDWC